MSVTGINRDKTKTERMIIVKNIKKIVKPIAGILTSCVLAVTLPYTAFATGAMQMSLSGKSLNSDDVQPMIYQERTMIPLRDISKALDATVYWFNESKRVQIVKYDTLLSLRGIGNSIMSKYKIVNGEPSETLRAYQT